MMGFLSLAKLGTTSDSPSSLEDAFGGKGYRVINRGRRDLNRPIISSERRPIQIKLPSRLGLAATIPSFHAQIARARRYRWNNA